MSGIVGIIANRGSGGYEPTVRTMVATLAQHRDSVTGLSAWKEAGICVGWSDRVHSGLGGKCVNSRDGALTFVFCGEIWPEPGEVEKLRSAGSAEAESPWGWIFDRYERLGGEFVHTLNGTFCGVLVDHRQHSVLVINDRYGVERLYIHERNGNVFFASEAKAILAVAQETRRFDDEGLAEYLAFGCTLSDCTLFYGVTLLPAASCWKIANESVMRKVYFVPTEWENQEPLPLNEFLDALIAHLEISVPRYAERSGKLGISLTAGLDTRMIMACLPAESTNKICFTYSGVDCDPIDARISAKLANARGMEHHVLRLGDDFFRNFAILAERSVVASDGMFGVLGAHEIYMSRLAYNLAPVRLTGNFGSEVLRRVSTLKPLKLNNHFITQQQNLRRNAVLEQIVGMSMNPVTFAAFIEAPFNLYGNMQAGRSEIGFRTPYLDNEFVKLAYRGPSDSIAARKICEALVSKKNPQMARIATDMGYLGNGPEALRIVRQCIAKVACKLDYYVSTGLPGPLFNMDRAFTIGMKAVGLKGLHKHLNYAAWLRTELSCWVRSTHEELENEFGLFCDGNVLRQCIKQHLAGESNNLEEINAAFSLGIVASRYFGSQPSLGRIAPIARGTIENSGQADGIQSKTP